MKGILMILAGFIILVVSLLVGGWVFSGFTMTSSAMDPNFPQGKMVFVSRVAKSIGRGTVVLAQVPGEETQVVRRVVGLPGEAVEYKDGALFINGTKVEEKYLSVVENAAAKYDVPAPANFGPITVPEGGYFLLGDNRLFARDSRVFSTVQSEAIIGVILPGRHAR